MQAVNDLPTLSCPSGTNKAEPFQNKKIELPLWLNRSHAGNPANFYARSPVGFPSPEHSGYGN